VFFKRFQGNTRTPFKGEILRRKGLGRKWIERKGKLIKEADSEIEI
jgi:hypothetical protein